MRGLIDINRKEYRLVCEGSNENMKNSENEFKVALLLFFVFILYVEYLLKSVLVSYILGIYTNKVRQEPSDDIWQWWIIKYLLFKSLQKLLLTMSPQFGRISSILKLRKDNTKTPYLVT